MIRNDYILAVSENGHGVLAHYGVLGMKWGVRNEDSERKYRQTKGLELNVDYAQGGGGLLPDELYEDYEKDFPLKDGEMTADEDMALINPLFAECYEYAKVAETDPNAVDYSQLPGLVDEQLYISGFSPLILDREGSVVNCATCSVIYDLRRRGYDIDANATTALAYKLKDDIGDFYKGAEFKTAKTDADLHKALDKMPDGARGVLAGVTVNGGGHAIAWEKENGEVVYRDCQSNEKYTKKNLNELFDMNTKGAEPASWREMMWERLDDKPANLSEFKKYSLASKTGTSKADRLRDALHANRSWEADRLATSGLTEADRKRIKQQYAKARAKIAALIRQRTSS